MTIYDLAHPAVNSTAPCWQGWCLRRTASAPAPLSQKKLRCALCRSLTRTSVGRARADQIASNQYSKRVPEQQKSVVEPPPGDKCEVYHDLRQIAPSCVFQLTSMMSRCTTSKPTSISPRMPNLLKFPPPQPRTLLPLSHRLNKTQPT